ncbi:hypothetical protein EON63_08895 [archaeon]|nr:MAG: hypothetical protein EON63_08895 [archaeon]
MPHTTTHCILVDEAQFLTSEHIDQLRLATVQWKVYGVWCMVVYGLYVLLYVYVVLKCIT